MVVFQIGDEEVGSLGIDRDGIGAFERGAGEFEGGELAGFCIDDADSPVEGIGEEESPVGMEGEVVHAVEATFGGGAAIAFGEVAEVLPAR